MIVYISVCVYVSPKEFLRYVDKIVECILQAMQQKMANKYKQF